MFSFGAMEIMVILAVALIVVGPKKLPDLAKSLGKGLREIRKATDELKSNITDNDAYQDLRDIKDTFKDTATNLSDDIYRGDAEGEIPGPHVPELASEAEKQVKDSAILPPPPPMPEVTVQAEEKSPKQGPANKTDLPPAAPDVAEGDKKPVKTDD